MSKFNELTILAESAPTGPWVAENDSLYFDDDGYTRHLLDADAGHDVTENGYCAALKFIAAANPKVVMELLAEVERLRTAEGDAMTYKAGMENCAAQRDELKAENKTLRYFLDRARGHLKIAGYANTLADIDNALDTGK